MDYDAVRRLACMNPPKTPAPKATEPSKPPPNPTPAPPPPGPPQGSSIPQHMGHYMEGHDPRFNPTQAPPPQGSSIPPHMGHYMDGHDPRFGYLEHSRTWKVGSHPDQEYYGGYHGNPGMNSRGNLRQIEHYPDEHMGSHYSRGNLRQIEHYPDEHMGSHYSRGNLRQIEHYPDCHQSGSGHLALSNGQRGISGPPPRLGLPPPFRYIDDNYNHHGFGQSSYRGYYSDDEPPVREFGPGARGRPPVIGPPPLDPYHCPGGPPGGGSGYYLPSTYESYFSDDNPNACTIS